MLPVLAMTRAFADRGSRLLADLAGIPRLLRGCGRHWVGGSARLAWPPPAPHAYRGGKTSTEHLAWLRSAPTQPTASSNAVRTHPRHQVSSTCKGSGRSTSPSGRLAGWATSWPSAVPAGCPPQPFRFAPTPWPPPCRRAPGNDFPWAGCQGAPLYDERGSLRVRVLQRRMAPNTEILTPEDADFRKYFCQAVVTVRPRRRHPSKQAPWRAVLASEGRDDSG
jgi:hypothetical protein